MGWAGAGHPFPNPHRQHNWSQVFPAHAIVAPPRRAARWDGLCQTGWDDGPLDTTASWTSLLGHQWQAAERAVGTSGRSSTRWQSWSSQPKHGFLSQDVPCINCEGTLIPLQSSPAQKQTETLFFPSVAFWSSTRRANNTGLAHRNAVMPAHPPHSDTGRVQRLQSPCSFLLVILPPRSLQWLGSRH